MASRVLLVCLLAIVADVVWAEEPRTAPGFYQVAAIRAHSYYPDLGAFDERDLFDERLALWNVIGGGGDAKAATQGTLVLVELSGPDFTSKAKGSVELRAFNDGGGELHRSSVPLMFLFTEKHRVQVPFLVWGTGCGDLTLKAKIDVKGRNAHERTAVIGFRCGE
jgi:hypothetical protein